MDNKPEIALPLPGCSDNGCVFGNPRGQGTNGGCACLKEIRSIDVRRKFASNISAFRKELRRLQEQKEPRHDD